MHILLIVLIIIVFIRLITANKKAKFSPAKVFGSIIAANAITFYIVVFMKIYPSDMSHFWQIKNIPDYVLVGNQVLLLYLIAIFLANVIERKYSKTKKSKTESVNKDSIETIPFNDKLVYEMLNSNLTVWLLFSINLLYIIHIIDVDFTKLLTYEVYLSVRDPIEVGIQNGFVSFIHKIIPLLGVLLSGLFVLFIKSKNVIMLTLTFFPLFYSLFVTISFASRFIVVDLFLMALLFYLINKNKLNFPTVFLGGLAVILYSIVISLRFLSDNRHGEFGVYAVINLLFSGNLFVKDNFILFSMVNFFGGGFVLARAFLFGQSEFFYPLSYKILSFSPFPSIIDSFDNTPAQLNRAAPTAPFSNFAEVYLFGDYFIVFFSFFLFLVLKVLTKYYHKFYGIYSIILFVPCYYAFLKMHAYPLRHSIRFMYISIFMVVLYSIFNKVNIKKKGGN